MYIRFLLLQKLLQYLILSIFHANTQSLQHHPNLKHGLDFSSLYCKMAGFKRRLCTESDTSPMHKALDEVLCPICMDHPHNAVLILCSSHEKGCRSYICDTSYRHSNCLDRYKKLTANTRNRTTLPNPLFLNLQSSNNSNVDHNLNESNPVRSDFHREPQQINTQDPIRHFESQEDIVEILDSESLHERAEMDNVDVADSSESNLSLKCPLCRGTVLGWEVVEEARQYLNLKKRSCSRDSCSFSGNYQDLRRHARRVHPTTRPSDVDPSRERAWRRLEHQREFGDVVSALRSAMPGAVVVGDYVIENGDRLGAGERASSMNDANGPWWTTLFLFQMIGSIDGIGESRARSRAWTRHRRSAGALPDRRYLWGENLLGLHEDDVDEDLRIFSDVGDDASPIPRRRRRLTRSRSDEEHS